MFRLRRFIKHSIQCFIGYPNTSNFVKNTLLHVVFSTLFLLFGYLDETLSFVFNILVRLHSSPSTAGILQYDQLPDGLTAKLVGQCTGIVGVMGSNPVRPENF